LCSSLSTSIVPRTHSPAWSKTGTIISERVAPPMTYVYEGKQYVVIAAGGHGKLGTKQGDYVLAFALP
jgi:glucose dehydrogenase